jgi:hypothetical protein
MSGMYGPGKDVRYNLSMTYSMILASIYDNSVYGRGLYERSTSTGQSSSPQNGSILANTGFDVALVITIACTIAFIAVLVRFWKRPYETETGQTDSKRL